MKVLVTTRDEIYYTISDMLGDSIITFIGLDAAIEYAEEKGLDIVNLYQVL